MNKKKAFAYFVSSLFIFNFSIIFAADDSVDSFDGAPVAPFKSGAKAPLRVNPEPSSAINGEDSREVDQEMHEFRLSSFSDKGKKGWEVKGSCANIFTDTVFLDDITANMYGDTDSMVLVADKGRYDKKDSRIHLEKDVVATTGSGARLATDSLDWLQNQQLVRTDDKVVIDKENMLTTAWGLRAKPDLNKVRLIKDVKVDINEQKPDSDLKNLTTITCDGPLEVDYKKEVAIFNKNVVVNNIDGEIYSDRMLVYFDFKNKKLVKIVARGNVKILKEGNTSYSQKAVYLPNEKTLVLTGRPKIIMYSEDSMGGLLDAPSGN